METGNASAPRFMNEKLEIPIKKLDNYSYVVSQNRRPRLFTINTDTCNDTFLCIGVEFCPMPLI